MEVLHLDVPQWMIDQALAVPGLLERPTAFGSMQDMWAVDMMVLPHTDTQPPGFWTYLWVLVNTLDSKFWQGGERVAMPPGQLMCFDGTVLHAATGGQLGGRLAFLAWDIPHNMYSLEVFRTELLERRVNI